MRSDSLPRPSTRPTSSSCPSTGNSRAMWRIRFNSELILPMSFFIWRSCFVAHHVLRFIGPGGHDEEDCNVRVDCCAWYRTGDSRRGKPGRTAEGSKDLDEVRALHCAQE